MEERKEEKKTVYIGKLFQMAHSYTAHRPHKGSEKIPMIELITTVEIKGSYLFSYYYSYRLLSLTYYIILTEQPRTKITKNTQSALQKIWSF